MSAEKLKVFIAHETGKQISTKTVKRYLSDVGLIACKARKVPLISQKNKNKRLECAENWLYKPKSYWKKVFWSDETKLNLYSSDGIVWVWRREGEEYNEDCTVKTIKYYGGNIILWGYMNARGVGKLVKIEEIINGIKYVTILQENLFDSAAQLNLGSDFLFQQDNDPKHKSARAARFFREMAF